MKTPREISPFTLSVEDLFVLGTGVTVFVGQLQAGTPPALAPCQAELFIDGRSKGVIQLESERMPGRGRPELRAVETRTPLDADEIRGRACLLVHR
ncbi:MULTISPECIES: hypothetical protein [unclassified Myxococcus]|uniref:hypothetical protein n=1 Tax=unclassified Myxococcus TaxID=2648731 RepID=UPI00157A75BC|nr:MULTISPECIES: hypothetical protein [unclassified Myxococcus]NTX34168.1 hypothetical protein [Myxococcus sp. CA033]NTX53118.1 hypothetical protein [Myxococcus sp. CA039A]